MTPRGKRILLLILIYLVLPLLSAILIVAGYALEHAEGHTSAAYYFGNGKELFAHIITEAGIAGVIAFLLAATVERLSSHEILALTHDHGRQLSENVFKYVFGYDVPVEIRKVIYEDILQIPLLRKNSVLKLTLDILPLSNPSNRCVRVKREYSYTVQNLTSKMRQYTIYLPPGKLKIADPTGECKHLSVIVTGSGNDIRLTEEELKRMQDEGVPGEPIPINIQLANNELAKVTIETQWERFLEGGHMHFIVNTHTIGLDLFVEVPKNDLVVGAEGFESNILIDMSEGLNPGSYHWRMDRPLLPYQGLYVTWAKGDAPTTPCPG